MQVKKHIRYTEILRSRLRWWGEIGLFFHDLVKISGYPYFEWNDRIYEVQCGGAAYQDVHDTIVVDQ